MADQLVKAVTVKVSVDGMDNALLKIGKITASAKNLAELHPEITPQINAARVLLEARLLRAGLAAELSKSIGGGGGRGFFGGLLGVGGAGAVGGGGSLLGLLGVGPGALGTGAITAGIGGGILAAASGVGGIIPAIAAAGMGIAAFGALAIPTFTKVTTAVTAVNAATTKVALNKAWAAIPPALVPIVKGVLAIQAAWDKMAARLQPTVTKILGVGLQIAQKLLPAILPFAQSAGNAILGLLKQFDRFASSAGFKSFMASMLKLAGPAITTIGRGIGQIGAAIGGMLQRMITPEGLLILGGMFKAISLGITGIGFAFEGLGKAIFNVGPVLLRMASGFLGVVQFIGNAMFALIGTVLHGVSNIATFLHLPFNGALRDAAKNFDSYGKAFSDGLQNARTNLRRWSFDLQNAPKLFSLKANITDLQAKLAAAKHLLADKDLTRTRRAKIEANIAQLQAAVAAAQAALATLQNKTIYINTISLGSGFGAAPTKPRAAGGWTSGLTLVGERGPELIAAPAGSYVYTNQQSRQMMGGMSAAQADAMNARLDALIGLTQTLIGVTASAPAATGAGLGAALNGGARAAGYRAMYPNRSGGSR